MTSLYLDRCKALTADINVGVLSDMQFGEYGGAGSGFSFRYLGRLPLIQDDSPSLYAGIKVPHIVGDSSAMRVRREVAFIGILSDTVPEIMPYVPNFITLLQVEGSDAAAILTEDVSENGKLKVRNGSASERVRRMLRTVFETANAPSDVLKTEVCDDTIAFDVAGQEKLLDFTPLPIDHFAMRE